MKPYLLGQKGQIPSDAYSNLWFFSVDSEKEVPIHQPRYSSHAFDLTLLANTSISP